ncbi:flagellar filament capping protein FliD [Niallia endozanthoxylica]|uniref:Flagellar hook-associated protein 2 n=1 Tax=Niallia endozanthoxylica TaxID=2036016 RepID=A0A5J5HDI4_9BACI|nr:flagellar filament capping protein FliD [Niallia endozanthoxylica]KAA9018038.1 flagellar filament capping protein FliD [Niallia endozanthoxylica]
MRISGLASGMDIDSIVSDMMKIKRMPLDKLKQQKQTMEWQRDDYREMNTLLLNFRSELTQMKLTTKYRTRETTTTDDSKVTATASGAASLSSYSISSVSKLASAETRVVDTIYKDSTFESKKSIYSQISKLQYTGTEEAIWKTGAIESKELNAKKGENGIGLNLTNIDTESISSWSVKVNGQGYKVVTNKVQSDLAENEVLVLDNKLYFKDALSIDSAIKVDYIAENRTDNISIPAEGSSIKLSQGAIQSINTSVTLKVMTDGVLDEEQSRTFTIDANTNDIYETRAGEKTVVGILNRETGEITLTEDMLRPAKDSKTSMTLEVTYNHKYTTFSLDTNTSKGARHDSFLISGNDSLDSVISRVNSANTGVNMFYDTVTGKMSLTRTETGDFDTGNEIRTSGGISDLLQMEAVGTSRISVEAENASFTINGLETNRPSNTFAINGVTFTLKQTFNDSTDATKNTAPPVTIAINNNNDAIFENIKGFIDKYNELIGKIQEKTQQERFKRYTPLTDEQREQLSDKQQEQWEEKAKSGLLRRDQTLTSLLSSMRMDFYGKVESEKINPIYNQLASIGIKTTANYLEGGKLEINEAELKKAIEEDPESIEALFNASGTNNSQKGIAQRLYDTVGRTMDILYEKAGKSYSTNNQFAIGKQLNNIDNQMDSLEDRLKAMEDRYYRQFTAMEKAIQNANQQSAYIMQNFSM